MDDFSIIPAADELHHALLLGVALVLSAAIGLERQVGRARPVADSPQPRRSG